jgi:integrase
MTLIDTGARPGREIFELKWGQIKFAPNIENTIVLSIQMSKTGKRTAIGRAPMLEALRAIANRNYGKSLEEVIDEYPNDYIYRYVEFISKRQHKGIRDPKFVKPSSFPRLFDSYLKRHNLLIDKATGKKRVMYSLRHTYATFALTYDQVPIHTLAKQMGTSVVMIEKHYSHLDALKAIEQLSGIKTRGLLG